MVRDMAKGTNSRAGDSHGGAELLSLDTGMVVQEIGWDEDVDSDLRDEVMDLIDGEMLDEDAIETVDVVLLWWRDDDGDVADGLVDALPDLSNDGWIWLMTPKVGRDGFIEPSDLAEGAATAGLSLTTTVNVSADWQAHRVVRPKGSRR